MKIAMTLFTILMGTNAFAMNYENAKIVNRVLKKVYECEIVKNSNTISNTTRYNLRLVYVTHRLHVRNQEVKDFKGKVDTVVLGKPVESVFGTIKNDSDFLTFSPSENETALDLCNNTRNQIIESYLDKEYLLK